MSASAKWLAAVCLMAALAATADDQRPAARVLGVDIAVDAKGRPVVDEATRRQLIENLRASFAAAGLPSKSGPVRVGASGVESQRVGLDRAAISVARSRPDGELELQCVHGDDAAAEFLSGAREQ